MVWYGIANTEMHLEEGEDHEERKGKGEGRKGDFIWGWRLSVHY